MRKSGAAVELAHAYVIFECASMLVGDQGSKLQGVEGAMDDWQRVWAPHPDEGYQLGLIVDVSTDTLTADPLQGREVSIIIYTEWCVVQPTGRVFTSMDAVSTTLVSCCA